MSPEKAGLPVVRMEGVSKRYGSVQALDRAGIRIRPSEVHAVLGENGAGKTTLLRVLAGHTQPDEGLVHVTGAGSRTRVRTPREAWSLGIGMVHQHLTLVPRLSVLENLVLGIRERAGGLRLPLADTRRRAGELMERTGLEVSLEAPVDTLGIGRRQRVEILKVLLRDPRILILDEPTAVLAPREVDGLLRLLSTLAAEGRAVVLVAHKLDEVLAVAERITVLREGRTVLEEARADVDAPALARAMVGRTVDSPAGVTGAIRRQARGSPVARLRGVSLEGPAGGRLEGVDLVVFPGEIVGVAGVEGNGQRELARVLAGLVAPTEGTAELPPRLGLVPQDRTTEGLIGAFDLAENLALGLQRDAAHRRGPLLRWGSLRAAARDIVERFDIRAPSIDVPASTLSGGNQQRLVVARALADVPGLLVAENPTRGLDVAAEAFVHARLLELRRRPHPPGVVLVSTDLDEILRLADRIFVMVRGRLVAVPPSRRSREGVGEAMLAGRP